MSSPVRLQKYLAQCGICSRRKAEVLIAEGRIGIDGTIVKEMGIRIIPGKHRITCNGKPVEFKEKLVYYLLNKPKGYVTTLSDPQGRPVVTSLLGGVDCRIFPVGRLDLDTEGALILTNDGAMAQKIQHPSHLTSKTYEALVKHCPAMDAINRLEKGILLEGRFTAPAKISILARKGRNCLVRIILHEGRKRQVKKMFSLIGHPVINLKRTAYGKLQLGNLPPGGYKQLNPSDLKKIFL